jgi:hypothetical protein
MMAIVIMVAMLGIYAGGYVALGDRIKWSTQPNRETQYVFFPYRWLAIAYRPMAMLEGAITGIKTQAEGRADFNYWIE